MPFTNSSFIQYEIFSDGDPVSVQQHQLLEVRFCFFCRLMFGSPNAQPPHQILHETTPVPLGTALLPLPLGSLFSVPVFQLMVEQFLSFLNIHAAILEDVAGQIVSTVLDITAGDRGVNFHIVVVVDFIQLTWMQAIPGMYPVPEGLGGGSLEEGTAVPIGAPAGIKNKLRVERVEEIEAGEELETTCCSICLDEFNCKDKEREVVKIPCGHVYHEPCILTWLSRRITCPLCRATLPLED